MCVCARADLRAGHMYTLCSCLWLCVCLSVSVVVCVVWICAQPCNWIDLQVVTTVGCKEEIP